MSLAFKQPTDQEYATKSEIHYMFGVSYEKIRDRIRSGQLAIHLIDGKIMINVEEARKVLPNRSSRKMTKADYDLFS